MTSIALTCALLACARREGIDERMPVALASEEDWNYATHPALALGADEVRDIAQHALETSSRFAPFVGRAVDAPLAGRLSLRVVTADVTPDPAENQPDRVSIEIRIRAELSPPLSDGPVVALVAAHARGTAAAAGRRALESAASRALDETAIAIAARTKSDEELVSDLASADAVRARVALDRLAARRHAAAYEPLVRLVRAPDDEESLRALGGLVMLDDVRVVRPIIDEAERRDLSYLLEAIYALGSIGGEDSEAYLFTLDSGHSDGRVRAAAREAITFARRRGTAAPREIP